MSKFSIGEQVSFLLEEGRGEVLRFDGKIYLIKDEFGFEKNYPENLLVKILQHSIEIKEIEQKDKVETKQKKYVDDTPYTTFQLKSTDYWEIDLHIEELLESQSGMTNFEILSEQMKHFRVFFRKAIDCRIKKMIVIHGYGEGILKNEIKNFLKALHYVDFYEADYKRYGQGATEIEVMYNRYND